MQLTFRSWRLIAAALAATIAAGACAWLFLIGPFRLVALDAEAASAAAPPVLGEFDGDGAISDVREWRTRRERLLEAFERHVYGPMPAARSARVIARTVIPPERAGGVPGVEQWEVELEGAGRFNLALAIPDGDGPAPVILMQTFCGNRAAFPGRPRMIAAPRAYYPLPCRHGVFDPLHRAIFGRWILGPPLERLLDRGYAVAIFYGGDVVPDDAEDAAAALRLLSTEKTGALAAWAWMLSRVVDVLQADPRLDSGRVIALGHSRYGKVALLAAATDERIAAAVALQAGRGGDALTRHRAGESVMAITSIYPHWFAPQYADYDEADPPVDQHHLLALIAPRPVLLGLARRDSWSDPQGAIGAAHGAAPAFRLFGAPEPEVFIRGGGHSVTEADWDATLDFLDRRLDAERD